jgi:ABC-type multidrug transport system ATPase subunit/pSer/pThr/pTyr-binding forkhead associated (FHA) protein
MIEASPGTLYLKRTMLLVEWPDGTRQEYPLVKDITRVGRGGEDNDLVVPAEFKSISRRHFEVRRVEIGYQLHDLGSGNGLLINGAEVTSALLIDGDEILIGMAETGQEVKFTFQAGNEARAAILEAGTQAVIARLAEQAPSGQPYLRVRLPQGQVRYQSFQKNLLVVGRDEMADLSLPYVFVSARHFELRRSGASFSIHDLGSANGTQLNNQPLFSMEAHGLHDQDIIRVGDERYGVSLSLTFINPLEQVAPLAGFSPASSPVAVNPTRDLVIGRADECDIHLGATEVSRRHARVRRSGSAWVLGDLGSVNGTFVNEQQVQTVELNEGSLIRIGSYVLLFQNGQLSPYQSNGMRLDVNALSVREGLGAAEKRLLDEVSFSVLPREFVAIVAGTGASKTALLNVLVGERPRNGQVWLNGRDLHRNWGHYRNQLGYVPREDALHPGLTVEQTLDYAAQLRLPINTGERDRKNRIRAVLETVGMQAEDVRSARINVLSLEKRKRVGIAVELLGDPRLVYLDDPTAGLDPGMEKKLLHTLRRIADEGRTVVIFTQAGANLLQVDQVAFLAQGRLVFFGPSPAALEFFEASDFADVYEKVEHSAEDWRKVYQQGRPEIYQKYILDRQASSTLLPGLPAKQSGWRDVLHQADLLTRRSISVLMSEPLTLGLIFMLLPLLGVLQVLSGSRGMLTGLPAGGGLLDTFNAYATAKSFLYVTALVTGAIGMLLPARDLLLEHSIYARERMMNLRLAPYLASKVVLYSLLVFLQAVIYLLIILLGVGLPVMGAYLPAVLEVLITLFLTMLTGLSLGLLISATSRTREVLLSLMPMAFFFQFFFSGGLPNIHGGPLELVSWLAPAHWSITALETSLGLPGMVAHSTPALLPVSWLVLVGMTIMLLCGAWLGLRKQALHSG